MFTTIILTTDGSCGSSDFGGGLLPCSHKLMAWLCCLCLPYVGSTIMVQERVASPCLQVFVSVSLLHSSSHPVKQRWRSGFWNGTAPGVLRCHIGTLSWSLPMPVGQRYTYEERFLQHAKASPVIWTTGIIASSPISKFYRSCSARPMTGTNNDQEHAFNLCYLCKFFKDLQHVLKTLCNRTGARDQNGLWKKNCLTLLKEIPSWLLGKRFTPQANCVIARTARHIISRKWTTTCIRWKSVATVLMTKCTSLFSV